MWPNTPEQYRHSDVWLTDALYVRPIKIEDMNDGSHDLPDSRSALSPIDVSCAPRSFDAVRSPPSSGTPSKNSFSHSDSSASQRSLALLPCSLATPRRQLWQHPPQCTPSLSKWQAGMPFWCRTLTQSGGGPPLMCGDSPSDHHRGKRQSSSAEQSHNGSIRLDCTRFISPPSLPKSVHPDEREHSVAGADDPASRPFLFSPSYSVSPPYDSLIDTQNASECVGECLGVQQTDTVELHDLRFLRSPSICPPASEQQQHVNRHFSLIAESLPFSPTRHMLHRDTQIAAFPQASVTGLDTVAAREQEHTPFSTPPPAASPSIFTDAGTADITCTPFQLADSCHTAWTTGAASLLHCPNDPLCTPLAPRTVTPRRILMVESPCMRSPLTLEEVSGCNRLCCRPLRPPRNLRACHHPSIYSGLPPLPFNEMTTFATIAPYASDLYTPCLNSRAMFSFQPHNSPDTSHLPLPSKMMLSNILLPYPAPKMLADRSSIDNTWLSQSSQKSWSSGGNNNRNDRDDKSNFGFSLAPFSRSPSSSSTSSASTFLPRLPSIHGNTQLSPLTDDGKIDNQLPPVAELLASLGPGRSDFPPVKANCWTMKRACCEVSSPLSSLDEHFTPVKDVDDDNVFGGYQLPPICKKRRIVPRLAKKDAPNGKPTTHREQATQEQAESCLGKRARPTADLCPDRRAKWCRASPESSPCQPEVAAPTLCEGEEAGVACILLALGRDAHDQHSDAGTASKAQSSQRAMRAMRRTQINAVAQGKPKRSTRPKGRKGTANAKPSTDRYQLSVDSSLPLPQRRYTDASFDVRVFPEHVPLLLDQFPLWYRRFHVPSPMDADTRYKIFGIRDNETVEKIVDPDLRAAALRSRKTYGSWRQPDNPFDLYVSRWTRGIGRQKEGVCPICYEEGRVIFLKTKTSQYNYHMINQHGISPETHAPFHPPVEFRSAIVKKPKAHDRKVMLQGKCHACQHFIDLQSVRDGYIMVPEIYWWKHASQCHKKTRHLSGTGGLFVENEVSRDARRL